MDANNWVGTIKGLSNIHRYSMASLSVDETVLEHSAMVAMICLDIGGSIDLGVNMGMLLTKALIHDVEESVTGDIPHMTKHISAEVSDALRVMEASAIKTIFKDSDALQVAWVTAKSGGEGSIVEFADAFVVLVKFYDEIIVRGNKSMIPLLSPTTFDTCHRRINNVIITYGETSTILSYKKLTEKYERELQDES